MKSYAICALAFGGNVDVCSDVISFFDFEFQNTRNFLSALREMQFSRSSVCFLLKGHFLSTCLISIESSREFRREFPHIKVFGFSGEIYLHRMDDADYFPRSYIQRNDSVVMCALSF